MRTSTNSREWPLIAFTLLSQAAAGMLFSWYAFEQLGALPFLLPQSPPLWYVPFTITVLLGSAGLIATLHLRRPDRAALAASNWKQSWLSREMVFALLFGSAAAALTLLEWVPLPLVLLRLGVRLLALLFAALLIWSMIQLYNLRTIPVWNSSATAAAFINSALLSGPAALLALLSFSSQAAVSSPSPMIYRITLMWLLLTLLAQMLLWFLHVRLLMGGNLAERSSAAKIHRRREAVWIRILATAAAIILILLELTQFVGAGPVFTCSLFLLLLLEETAGRFQFYAGYQRKGF